MLCAICRQKKPTTPQTYFNTAYIPTCTDCHNEVQKHRKHPYSKVMDNVALAETGYLYNRKQAQL